MAIVEKRVRQVVLMEYENDNQPRKVIRDAGEHLDRFSQSVKLVVKIPCWFRPALMVKHYRDFSNFLRVTCPLIINWSNILVLLYALSAVSSHGP